MAMVPTTANIPSTHQEVKDDEDLRCGYGQCRPNWLQRFNTPRFLLSTICFYCFTHGFMVFGITNVNTSTLERRYEMTSNQVAWITSSYDLYAGILAVIFGYLGTTFHNGKIITIGAISTGLGAFIMYLPQAISPDYALGSLQSDICDLSENKTYTDPCEDKGSQDNYLWMFFIGQFFIAFGGAALYTLGIPYLDNNVKMKNLPLYIGIMNSFSALGPAFGFIFGGLFLGFYVDFATMDSSGIPISPSDPRWVGAWWLGYVYTWFAGLTVAVFMNCFARELPIATKRRTERVSQAYKDKQDGTKDVDAHMSMTDIWEGLKIFGTNPTFIFLTLGGMVESSAVVGFATFLPKVLQFQFSQSSVMAAIWSGVVVVPGAAGGNVLGGIIPRLLNVKIRGLILQCVICCGTSFFLVLQFLLRCDMPLIAGINTMYQNSTLDLDNECLINQCNIGCNCSDYSYDPVCGSNQIQYFTPCHAGCLDEPDIGAYDNCSCVSLSQDIVTDSSRATKGFCDVQCDSFSVFLFLFFLINLTTFVSSTAGQAATVRSIPDRYRAFGLGIQALIVRYGGNVPGPLIIGAIFDDACLKWNDNCGVRGACWIYDGQGLSSGIVEAGLIIKVVSTLCFIIALFSYRAPKIREKDVIEVEVNVDGTDINSEKEVETGYEDSTHSIGRNGKINGINNCGFQNNSVVSSDVTGDKGNIIDYKVRENADNIDAESVNGVDSRVFPNGSVVLSEVAEDRSYIMFSNIPKNSDNENTESLVEFNNVFHTKF